MVVCSDNFVGRLLLTLCLCLQDSTLIATGSADRNVKIWGLDFGDCHRSMFAHDDRSEPCVSLSVKYLNYGCIEQYTVYDNSFKD